MSNRKATHSHFNEDKIVVEIMNYFTKLCKNYYSVLFHPIDQQGPSIWHYLEGLFVNNVNHSYTQFV